MKYQILRRSFILGVLAVAMSVMSATAALAQPPARASAPQDASAYSRYYGDGLRHYAEGDFEAAVENLFRAYALRAKASTMRLIVDSYDKMGFCDAASRQLSVYRMVHPDAPIPKLSRCGTTGTLQVQCEGPQAAITVDHQFDVTCGERVALPTGEHRLTSPRAKAPVTVTLQKNQLASTTVALLPAPKRWKAARAQVSKLGDIPINVARLGRAGPGYTVFQSPDGLYQIFIRPNAAGSGAVIPLPFRPDVLRLCDSGERFDTRAKRCVPVDGMQVQKME